MDNNMHLQRIALEVTDNLDVIMAILQTLCP